LFSLVSAFSPEPKCNIRIGAPRLSIQHQSILKHDSLMTTVSATVVGGKAGVAEFTELRWITIETGPQQSGPHARGLDAHAGR